MGAPTGIEEQMLIVGGLLDEARADVVALGPGVVQGLEAAQPLLDA